jgi:polar amino acid transport system permease protein
MVGECNVAELMKDIIFVGQGIFLTLELLVGGLFLGMVLGTLLSILRYNHIACFFVRKWVSILRGTPLLLQLSFIYFTTPGLFGIEISVLCAGIVAFGLNSSAYIAEILRAGIESVPKGQFEAAKTLEVPNYYIWKDIILPQVMRNIFPSLINEVIALLKETALIGTISGMDLMRMAQTLGAEQFTYFMPLCIAAAYYYVLVLIIEYAGKIVEKGQWYAKN